MSYHAWYSAQAASKYGSVRYARANGEIVEVTAVCKDKEWGDGDSYRWPDKKYVGKVKDFVGQAKPDRSEELMNAAIQMCIAERQYWRYYGRSRN